MTICGKAKRSCAYSSAPRTSRIIESLSRLSGFTKRIGSSFFVFHKHKPVMQRLNLYFSLKSKNGCNCSRLPLSYFPPFLTSAPSGTFRSRKRALCQKPPFSQSADFYPDAGFCLHAALLPKAPELYTRFRSRQHRELRFLSCRCLRFCHTSEIYTFCFLPKAYRYSALPFYI